jgi:hypothetical protein
MQEITLDTAVRALEAAEFNFLRRTAELTLSMSGARWRLAERTPDTLTFRALDADGAFLADEMALPLADVERITWDRLPRQQSRSQLRLHLRNGEMWIFSGHVAPTLLPEP